MRYLSLSHLISSSLGLDDLRCDELTLGESGVSNEKSGRSRGPESAKK